MTRAKNKWPKSDEKGRFGGTLPCKPRHIWPAAAFGHYQSFSENDTPADKHHIMLSSPGSYRYKVKMPQQVFVS